MSNRAELAQELESIRLANGGQLSPKVVVDAARPHNSILHNYFEWDDDVAGELYREAQARKLIKIIRIEVSVEARHIIVPKYQVAERGEDDDGSYEPVTMIMSDELKSYHTAYSALVQARSILRNVPHPVTQHAADRLDKEIIRLKRPGG
jgi:hypothetical protein